MKLRAHVEPPEPMRGLEVPQEVVEALSVLPVVRCERRTSLTANAGCWHARPMGIHATLMLAPGCSPWRPQSEPTTSPDAVTDGGGGADMRRASNRLSARIWVSSL